MKGIKILPAVEFQLPRGIALLVRSGEGGLATILRGDSPFPKTVASDLQVRWRNVIPQGTRSRSCAGRVLRQDVATRSHRQQIVYQYGQALGGFDVHRAHRCRDDVPGLSLSGVLQTVVVIEEVGDFVVKNTELSQELLSHGEEYPHVRRGGVDQLGKLVDEYREVARVFVILKDLFELIQNQDAAGGLRAWKQIRPAVESQEGERHIVRRLGRARVLASPPTLFQSLSQRCGHGA